jgi:protease-4
MGPLEEKVVEGSGADKIVLIDISGVISEEGSGGLIEQPDMVSQVKEELSRAKADKTVKGIILRVNSPGGTVTASDLIYHEIRRFKEETGKKVVASIVDVGASGAYYISMAADRIMAHPTSVTGSIGVIMLHVNFQGLLEKIGVNAESIKSGPMKDLGSPIKPLSKEERDILQKIINSMYGRFLEVIIEGRKGLQPERIKELADGRVYTASEAREFGLVDEIGYLDQAINLVKSEAGIKEAKVVLYHRRGRYKNNIYSQMAQQGNSSLSVWGVDPKHLLQGGSAKFFYLWAP